MQIRFPTLFVPILITACAPYPEGLRLTPDGSGPMVIIDWDATPLPDIPLPNDLATRPDPYSVTGLRLNISEIAVTEMEMRARRKINLLTGFGVFAPVTVAFDEPLDLDEIVARHADDGDYTDDAFFLVDVDPKSPDYLQPVRLDVGHGRFPQDLDETDRYFPNDPRSDSPALLFETAEEDLNANGILDPGEDTDNDGVLDHPNVYPKGGDPREDLLTWYERESDTLIVRPVVPLREETTYAVVLTDRLIGEDGEPIRSPWAYVHHLRQTEALQPVIHALPAWGLQLDNLAFAWTFTTGRITGDLIDLRRGLYGSGPWHWLGEAVPPSLHPPSELHDNDDLPTMVRLPVSTLLEPIANLGLLGSEESSEVMLRAYRSFSSDIVGGAFNTPYLLVDTDDGGHDDTDEYWRLDPVRGTVVYDIQRVPFTCVLPKETEDHGPPYSVAFFGHGYGSSRFDMFGFAWAINRLGIAACAMDFPGHGPTLDPDQEVLVEGLLNGLNLLPFLDHLRDARFRDVDNDGVKDSGADQWIADSFHTRDMVRQAVLDTMQIIRGLRTCGGNHEAHEGDLSDDFDCDWDDDGIPDIGGPDVDFFMVGGSLGGINTAITAAVEPELTASVPIVGAGGLMDIGIRSPLTGVVEAVIGRLITPLIIGVLDEDGGLSINQLVISGRYQHQIPMAHLDSIPGGGQVLVENLDKGIDRLFDIPESGAFRVPIPADAPNPFEKRVLAGMPLDNDEPLVGPYTVKDNKGLGDRLRITVWDSDGAEVAFVEHFESDASFEGVTYTAGSPLVAGAEGLGHWRGSPSLRRLASFTGMMIEPGDPIAYARYYNLEPLAVLGGEPRNVLIMPTPGDMVVAVNAEIALARAAGMVDYENIDPRYGMTVDQWLIDTEVVRGLEQFGPWTNEAGEPVLFDADDLDDGTDGTGAPSDAPLRVTVKTDSGFSGMRLPYVSTQGSHGFLFPDPTLAFDINSFSIHQVARYFQTRGQVLTDEPCMADHSCDWLPPMEDEGGDR